MKGINMAGDRNHGSDEHSLLPYEEPTIVDHGDLVALTAAMGSGSAMDGSYTFPSGYSGP